MGIVLFYWNFNLTLRAPERLCGLIFFELTMTPHNTMKATVEDIRRIEARIMEMKAEIPAIAGRDPEFHDALKANPQAAIEQYYGLTEGLLKDIKIQIFEEAPGSIGLVIPPDAKQMEEELTEEQLEAVAGGAGFTVFVGSLTAFVAVAAVAKVYRNNRDSWG